MIVEFTVSVKVPDPKDNDLQNDPDIIEQMDAMLAVLEDKVNKKLIGKLMTYKHNTWEVLL